MVKCSANLVFHSNLDVLVAAIRQSRDSMELSDSTYVTTPLEDSPNPTSFTLGDRDRDLILKCLQNDEGSVFEHLIYQFILEMPRSVLQEFARHRIGVSMTVRSTRYTLKNITPENVNQYVYSSPYDSIVKDSLLKISEALQKKEMTQDEAKIMLPEGVMTKAFVTMNARSLNHMFRLRHRKKVYKPFYLLVERMYDVLPEAHKFIFEKAMYQIKP